jgi:hypothetical protein
VLWQKFHSPALAGFELISHWVPFLLFASGVGGVIGGILLEVTGRIKPTVKAAVVSTAIYGVTTLFFALTSSYLLALALLLGGIANLASMSIGRTIVQLLAPPADRGRIIGRECRVRSAAGRTETGDSVRQDALGPGFHGVPAGPAPGRAIRLGALSRDALGKNPDRSGQGCPHQLSQLSRRP